MSNCLKIYFLLPIIMFSLMNHMMAQSGSLGNTFVHETGEANIFGQHNFNLGGMGVLPGIVGTEREGVKGYIGFSNISVGWLKAANDRHVDGYVKKYGNTPFVFPIGDNGVYRPIATTGGDQTSAAYFGVDPQVAITTDILGGNHPVLPSSGPFSRTQKQSEIFRISDREYWDINGTDPTRITLTWNAESNIDFISDGQLSRLSIIGWDGDKWVRIPSKIDILNLDINKSTPTFLAGLSNKTRGAITTERAIVPDTYEVYTFGSVASGIIGDLVWDDLNRNGIQDPDEPGIEGVQVQLFTEAGELVQTIVSQIDGSYLFNGVLPGRYYLVFNAPDPYSITLPGQGDPTLNSDLGFDKRTLAFTIDVNEVDLSIDAGFYKTGYVGDYVWIDANRDGIQQNDELPMPNVRVELLGPEKLLLASTNSDIDGSYFFTNLPPGDYYIRIELPDGYQYSPYKATIDDTKDSDINPLTGITDVIKVQSGIEITSIDIGLSSPCDYVADIELTMPECGLSNGEAMVIVTGNTAPYRFEWSNGDTGMFATSLDTGFYTLVVTDSEDCSRAFTFRMETVLGCETVCANLSTAVYLEGPYDYDEGKMSNLLNRLGYLPGQRPTTFFGKRTAAGQPYNEVPWNYEGTEGATFNSATVAQNNDFYDVNVIDWVLVSLRSNINEEYETCTRAGLLYDDGHIEFPTDECCIVDPSKSYYVVIEHRNHLIVMSRTRQPVVNGTIEYDFRDKQSYVRLLGDGQKQVSPGIYAMFAGNGDQFINPSSPVDINVVDLAEWLKENGQNSSYYKMDFDLNGDANVVDKGLYLQNTGTFTDVPKGN